MYHYKTGALVEGLAEAAAIIANASEPVKRACMEFARDFSVAFQIMDDIHNFSGSAAWTKQHAEDFMEGKLTFVVVTALQRLSGSDRDRLSQILCDATLRRDPATLEECVALVKASGAPAACRAHAEELSQRSWEALAAALPNSWSRMMLRLVTLHLLRQDYDGERAA